MIRVRVEWSGSQRRSSRIAQGEVVTVFREQSDVGAVLEDLETPAVVFELMAPHGPVRRVVALSRQRRRNERERRHQILWS